MNGDKLFGLGDSMGKKEDKAQKVGWNHTTEVC